MHSTTRHVTRAALGFAIAAGLAVPAALPALSNEAAQQGPAKESLRREAPRDLLIGSAVAGGGHHEQMPYPAPFTDPTYRQVLAEQFSSVTPENQLKWEFVHPERDRYRFGPADEIVDFARRNGQEVRGHTLLWHSQNPAWLENGSFTKEELRGILKDHIETVVGHYRGKIYQWDVANEIFDDRGNLRTQENIWIRELGPGIVADAFRWAHAADPAAKLFLNDYGSEGINARTNAYYQFAKDLLAEGVPLDGFAAQAHLSLQYGFDGSLAANLQRFDALGLQTAITELDVRMPLGPQGATADQLARQASYYDQTLEACISVPGCTSFTIWGFNDRYSWVPVFFRGQGAATVMWEDYTPKPAYFSMLESLRTATPGRSPRAPMGL